MSNGISKVHNAWILVDFMAIMIRHRALRAHGACSQTLSAVGALKGWGPGAASRTSIREDTVPARNFQRYPGIAPALLKRPPKLFWGISKTLIFHPPDRPPNLPSGTCFGMHKSFKKWLFLTTFYRSTKKSKSLKTLYKNQRKTSFFDSQKRSQKQLFWSFKNIHFWDGFWISKKLVLLRSLRCFKRFRLFVER